MASRIAASPAPAAMPTTKPKKSAGYLAFIRSLPCCVTGRRDVEAAHVNHAAPKYGHYGRAKGHKAPDRWCLPLCTDEHRKQHQGNEAAYWRAVGIDPHVLCLTIWGLWSDMGDDAEPFATAIVNQALATHGRPPEKVR